MHLLVCVLAVAVVAMCWPSSGMCWAARLGAMLDALAARRAACVLGIAILSLLYSFGSNLVLKTPAPRCADEFGYLLEADTFAHGRLMTATHPLWRYFETFHEIFQPSHTAKFPPAQGAAIAFGQLLHKPILGVWLTTAFACAAVLWMLFAWLPPRWTLAVSLLVVFNPQIAMWNWTYWGGSIALGAGALLLGGYRRIADPASDACPIGTGVMMGIGMGILAVSRPYEGFVLSAVVMVVLLFDLASAHRLSVLLKAAPPIIVIVAAAGAFILHYNKVITGNPLLMPYVLYERTYDAAPLFLWQKLPAIPDYRHAAMRDFYLGAREYAAYQQTLSGFIRSAIGKLEDFGLFFWSAIPLIFFLAVPGALREDRWLRRALIIALASAAAISMSNYVFNHYEAPVLPLLFVFIGACMQRVWRWRLRNRPTGATLVAGLAILMLLYSFGFFFIRQLKNQRGANWGFWRDRLAASLSADGHKNLVLVRYSRDHDLNQEWVYNAADLDSAPVLWARDMRDTSPDANRELLDAFKDRTIWVFNPDTDAKPQPYGSAAAVAKPGSI